MAALNVNGKTHQVDVDPDTPLLWVLREQVGLTGTKYGCGIAQCGACTVHIDGVAMRSCSLPVSLAEGKQITTIEGLAQNGVLHKVQKAWIDHDVPQCGYCQTGMIMAVAALLKEKPQPTDGDIDANITNICRCGTFIRCATLSTTAAQCVTREAVDEFRMPTMNRRTFVAAQPPRAAGLRSASISRSAAHKSSVPRTARPRSMPGW